jgi:large subunit ribosomal protein L24
MSVKLHIKKGDTVKVIAGDHKGTTGVVSSINVTKSNAIIEGVNKVKRHTKPSAQNPQGGIVEKEAPIHISNLMLVVKGQATRIGRKVENDKIVRYAKKTKEVIK